MLINVEEFHAHCLDETIKFSRQFMIEKYGQGECFGLIIRSTEEEVPIDILFSEEELDFGCDIVGKIKLPLGTSELINNMALFCKTTLSHITKLNGTNLTELPPNTYALSSLLEAAFPKNVRTGVFRAHDGALSIGDMEYPDFRAVHVAFSGIGVILMNETRKILSPLSPDSEVINMSDELFLSIFNEEPK